MTARTRRLLALAALAAVLALVGLLVARDRLAGRFPAPREGAEPRIASADFVGAETCGACHEQQFAAWRSSTHGRAGGPPTHRTIIAPFDGRPLRLRDALVTPAVADDGAFVFRIAQPDRPESVLRVDAVVGRGLMVGGGTQTFFNRFADGTLRFLPFDYSAGERRWFCQLRGGRGWMPVTPAIGLADCDAWPPRRVLGRHSDAMSERFQTCQQCHGSQLALSFDPVAKRYGTDFTDLAINCESCHGPGRAHVELARSGRLGAAADIGMRPLETLTKDQSLAVCFQCHAVKTALEPGFFSGNRLERFYALKLPLLLDTIYFADGRTRVFAYQEAHLASDCYLNGSMTCGDCHDPHSQRYRDVTGTSLPGRFDNGQCLGCHPSKAEPLERHTRHPPRSPGSRCVSCHMPYLQQPNVGGRIPYARSDHAIPIPRPAHDAALGIASACRQCHADQSVARLDAQVAQWYGELKPHPDAVDRAFAAERLSDPAAATARILDAPAGTHPWADFVGLAHVWRRTAGGDTAMLDRAAIAGLEERARSADPDVQALALATLHLVRGDDSRVRRFLARQLRGLGARDAIVRSRWAWILRVRGDALLAAEQPENALTAYGKALELRPDDPDLLRSRGNARTRLRDYAAAVEEFNRSLSVRADDPQSLVGLGFALMQQDDRAGAEQAFRRATAANPWDPAGYANLGVLELRRGAVERAIESLRQAVGLEPGLAAAQFALAQAYARQGRRVEAAAALERGLEVEPGNQAAQRMLHSVRTAP